jgi:hypothetical protein
MMPHAPRTRLLVALFDLTQANETIELYSLADEAGLNLYRTLSEIHALSLAGFVDARRLRLTASGLALAVALNARLRVAPNVEGRPTVTAVPNMRRNKPLDAGSQQAQCTVRDIFQRDLVA